MKWILILIWGLTTAKYPRILSIRTVNNEKGKYEYRVQTRKHQEIIYYCDTIPKEFR